MLAIIGGSGFAALKLRGSHPESSVHTPWGNASGPVRVAELHGQAFLYLARHGDAHTLAPHRINYRANLWQLKSCGASAVLGVNAVGSMQSDRGPAELMLPEQLIDYTFGRESSFHDGSEPEFPLRHIEFTRPFDSTLRAQCLSAAAQAKVDVFDGGCYAVTQGPRLETEAEVARLMRDGCNMVGMTAMPEAALARELDLPYALIAVVANYAAGLDEAITMEAIYLALDQGMAKVSSLLEVFGLMQS